jgi:hypothetical protein
MQGFFANYVACSSYSHEIKERREGEREKGRGKRAKSVQRSEAKKTRRERG